MKIISQKNKTILFTCYPFDGWHGSMLQVCEIAEYLSGIGYNCFCASVRTKEKIVDYAKQKGLKVFKCRELPMDLFYDIVWSYHSPVLGYLLQNGLKYNKIHVGCLSSFVTLEVLPPIYEECSLASVMSEETRDVLVKKFNLNKKDLFVLPNMIPTAFSNKAELSGKLNKIIVVSNHAPKELLQLPKFMPNCKVDFFGMNQKNYCPITPDILKEYDCVITIGKTVQYALGMGIPVYEYDYMGGCGYITPENYEQEAYFNFSGRKTKRHLTSQEIADELIANYDSAYKTTQNMREIALEKYFLPKNIDKVINIMEKKNTKTFSPAKTSYFYAISDAFIDFSFHYLNELRNMYRFERKYKKYKLLFKLSTFITTVVIFSACLFYLL